MELKKIIKYVLMFLAAIIVSTIVYINLEFKIDLKTTTFSHEEKIDIDFKGYFRGKDITDEVSVKKGTFDGTIGQYEITFIYWNNNKKYIKKKKIFIVDTVPPKIDLMGGNKIVVTKDTDYQELGYNVIDNYDGDIKKRVSIIGEVDTTKVGIYKIIYTAKDSSGNEGKAIREVEVVQKSPLDMSIEEFSLNELFNDSILKHNVTKNDYQKDILAIGDNILYYNINNKISFSKDSLSRLSYFYENKKIDYKINDINPKIILLSFEYDNLSSDNMEELLSNYNNIIEKLKQHNLQIIVVSHLPVENSILDNDNINKFNYYLAELCSKNSIKFLNVAESLKNSDGLCSNEFCKNNELTEKGKIIVNEYLINHQYMNN